MKEETCARAQILGAPPAYLNRTDTALIMLVGADVGHLLSFEVDKNDRIPPHSLVAWMFFWMVP